VSSVPLQPDHSLGIGRHRSRRPGCGPTRCRAGL